MNEHDNFIEQYLQYIGDTEAPQIFHRWCAISLLGVWLGRSVTFKFGHTEIFPNNYIMLMGTPGTRKSSAIKIAKKLLKEAGYDKFAGDKTSKEKFLLDLSGEVIDTGGLNGHDVADKILDQNLWGRGHDSTETSELFIAADEFNDFVGNGNIEFISLLGNLWDYNGTFKNKVKNSKSVNIPNPTISILSGNTPTGFSLAFPADTMGQGFFSRLLLIHGDTTEKKITFPKPPDGKHTARMVETLGQIRGLVRGEIIIPPLSMALLDKIYTQTKCVIEDLRFSSYVTRRFSHLMKLVIIVAAGRVSRIVSEEDIIYANTILTHAEHMMPKALGDFGRSRMSGLAHRLLEVLDTFSYPVGTGELWKNLMLDFDSQNQMVDLMRNLSLGGRIQAVAGGFLPVHTVIDWSESMKDTVDFSILTAEERGMTK